MAWELYDQLIAGIPEDLTIRRCQVGLHWILVESAGTGMAMTPTEGMPRHSIGRLAGKTVREVAAFSKSWNFLEAAIGIAAMNSWYNAPSTLAQTWASGHDALSDVNLFEEWETRLAGKRVAVIGHFPGLESLARVCALSILERKPLIGDFPDPACEFLLPEQDCVIATGTTLMNKTLPRLLTLSGTAEFALTGPTTPLAPVLFEHGVTQLAGSVVADPETVWSHVAEGGDRSVFRHGTRMLRLSRTNLLKEPNMSDSVKNEIHGWVADGRACGAGAVADRVREGAAADLEALPQMLAWKSEGRDCLLVTVAQAAPDLSLPVGSRLALSGDGRMSGQLGGSGLEAWVDEIFPTALSKGESRLLHLGRDEAGFWAEVATPVPEGVSLLVEAFPAPLEVVIFGAGAVSMKLGELCAVMGIPFRVWDDRPEAADPTRFPAARSVHCQPLAEALKTLPLGVHSHCVVMTAGHAHDAEIAANLLQRPHIPYVGVMHNPKKALSLGKDILARGGVPDKRFYCPVGLGIGWGGIAAIAIAELAEIVALQSDCSTGHNTLDWDAFVREQG